MVPDQKEQVGHRLLERVRIPCRSLDLVDEVSAQPTMDIGVGVGIPPAKIGFQHVTGHVVREDSGLGFPHDREITQPFPQFRGFLGVCREGGTEQRLGGGRRMGSDLQRGTMSNSRRMLDHLVEQSRHYVRQILQCLWYVGAPSRATYGIDQ